MSQYYVGYVNYIVVLFLLTGGMLLRFEVKGYELASMHKERKAARILGWCNLSLSLMIYLGYKFTHS